VSQNQIEPYLTASKTVREDVAGIVSAQSFKKLTSRRLFHFLYLLRYLEHFHMEIQQAIATTAQDSAVERESTMYSRASGFVHSGLYETAMYAISNNPKVSEHLFRNARRALRNTTLRLLHVSLDFHVQMLRDANTSPRKGVLDTEELMSRTTSLQTIAEQYRVDLAALDGRPRSS
jgi:hypothetical protein